MCKCQNKPGFNQKLSEAKAAEKKTGEKHVVFYMPVVKHFFVGKESDLNDELGICCYFLSDGTEVKYTPTGNDAIQLDANGSDPQPSAASGSDSEPSAANGSEPEPEPKKKDQTKK